MIQNKFLTLKKQAIGAVPTPATKQMTGKQQRQLAAATGRLKKRQNVELESIRNLSAAILDTGNTDYFEMLSPCSKLSGVLNKYAEILKELLGESSGPTSPMPVKDVPVANLSPENTATASPTVSESTQDATAAKEKEKKVPGKDTTPIKARGKAASLEKKEVFLQVLRGVTQARGSRSGHMWRGKKYEGKKTAAIAAGLCGVSESSMYRIQAEVRETGTLSEPKQGNRTNHPARHTPQELNAMFAERVKVNAEQGSSSNVHNIWKTLHDAKKTSLTYHGFVAALWKAGWKLGGGIAPRKPKLQFKDMKMRAEFYRVLKENPALPEDQQFILVSVSTNELIN
jgi:transposase